MNSWVQENKRQQLADKYNVNKSQISNKDVKNYDKGKKREQIEGGVGAGVATVGVAKASKLKDHGYITGRRSLYHGTNKKNIEAIKEKGVKAFAMTDPEAKYTRDVLQQHVDAGLVGDADKKLAYFGKTKKISKNLNLGKTQREASIGLFDSPSEALNKIKQKKKEQGMIHAKVPYEDYKRFKTAPNPEVQGAKNKAEYFDKYKNMNKELVGMNIDDLPKFMQKAHRKQSDMVYDMLGPKGTKVLAQSLDPKYIKGSKHYKGNSPKEIANYIKNNPKRFLKGVGKYGLAGAGVAGGGALIADSINRNMKSKSLEGLRGLNKKQEKKAEAQEYIMEKMAKLHERDKTKISQVDKKEKIGNKYLNELGGILKTKMEINAPILAAGVKVYKDNQKQQEKVAMSLATTPRLCHF